MTHTTRLRHGLVATFIILAAVSCKVADNIMIDDAKVEQQMPGKSMVYKMPERIFTPEMLKKLRTNGCGFLYPGKANRASKWTSIPLSRWNELICDIAPASISGNSGNPSTLGISPFTGNPFAGTEMSVDDFIEHPFQVKEKGTNFIIYAREKDMPENYPAKPNHIVKIPHLDGTMREYRFYVPEKFKSAGPEFSSARQNWFCPEGEVWAARLKIISNCVIPDLVNAIVKHNDQAAVKTLTVILDRISDVYPGLPLYNPYRAHGFARSRDRKEYLTLEQYRSIAPKQPFINARDRDEYPFWYVDVYDFSMTKLAAGVGGWTDGAMSQIGWKAVAFDLIRDNPEVRAYSKKKYGDPGAWEKRFRERYIKNAEYLAMTTPPTTGNTSYGYINGAVSIGIAAQNPTLFNKGLEIVELYMYNNWSPDGMAGDSAYNYAGMTQMGILGLNWLNDMYGGNSLAKSYPLKKRIDELGASPIISLLGIPSQHADQHSMFFRSSGKAPKADKLPYKKHEASMVLPFYGLTALRGGKPGHRMEVFVEHQNAFQHGHLDRLNYQIFYQGVNCLPDFGYCVGYIKPDQKPWSEVKTGYELQGLPEQKTDFWGPWKWSFGDRPEAHNILMVDNWLYNKVPCSINAYAGVDSMKDPGWWAQFLDVKADGIFIGRPNPVEIYTRQFTLLTLPGGTPLLIEVFRVKGGKRHDLFFHVPADRSQGAEKGVPIKADNLADYHDLKMGYDKLTGKSTRYYGAGSRHIKKLSRNSLPEKTWREEWLIQPTRAFPTNPKYSKPFKDWKKVLPDVFLDMWSGTAGTEAKSEMIRGRSPYPGGLLNPMPTVALKDALDYRIQSRISDKAGLESTFVSAIETRTKTQNSAIADFIVDNIQPLNQGGGITCRIKLLNGRTGFYASTLDGGKIQTSEQSLTGRMGVLFPETFRLAMIDGTLFKVGNWMLKTLPSWHMSLVTLNGDLTGNPEQSELIVETDQPLPTDGSLNGQFVYVTHKCNPQLQSVYPISGVSHIAGNRWKIVLAGSPPFIMQRTKVLSIDPKNPHNMEQAFQFHILPWKNKQSVEGRRIRFLRSGFETSMVSCERSKFTIKDKPPKGAIRKNDSFVVFNIQKDDKVFIPNRFACKENKRDKSGIELAVSSTGPFELTMPGQFKKVTALDTVKGKPAPKLTVKNNSCTIKIEDYHLRNGKGIISLSN